MKRRWRLTLLMLGLLAGCQSATPTPVVIPTPIAIPTPVATPTRVAVPTTTPGPPAASTPPSTVTLRRVDGSVVRIRVEIADTASKRATGLSGRERLDPDAGMLFVFEQLGRYEFWMRGTTVPLSIAFIADDGTIVDIQDMTPLTEDRHAPSQSYRFALEANRGFFRDQKVQVGDRAEIPITRRGADQ